MYLFYTTKTCNPPRMKLFSQLYCTIMNTQETRKYFHVCLKNRNFVVIYKVQFTKLQFLIRAINKPNLVLFETLIAKYMCVCVWRYFNYPAAKIKLANKATAKKKLGSKLHCYNFGLYKTVYFIWHVCMV